VLSEFNSLFCPDLYARATNGLQTKDTGT